VRLLTLGGDRLPARQAASRVIQELKRLDADVGVTCNYTPKEMRVASR
jgi:hypothetical protein